MNNILSMLSRFPHDIYHVTRWENSSSGADGCGEFEAAGIQWADIISSQIRSDDLNNPGHHHTIMLDLDVPAQMIPSSTPGHSHLYIDVVNDWDTYCKLLDALVAANVLEAGYVRASKARGFTALRLPWIKKGYRHEDN